jgi:recombination protein RecT
MAKAVQPKKLYFSQAMQTEKYKKLINNTLGDPVRAARFAANITSAVAVNPTLQECDAGTILAGALLGESLLLQPSPQLGQFYLVPFESKAKRDRQGNVIKPACLKAQFVLGYKGYIQLALRTGQYKRLNVLEVKSGELGGWDPFEERFHEMHFIEDFEKRAAMPTVGYIAHFEYINGFQKTLYWTADQMMSHADKYSPAFSAAAYKKLLNGEIPQNELWKYSSFWYKDFDGMAKKTMLRQLISKWGIMTAEMTMAYERDGHVMMPDTASGDLLPEVTDTPELSQQDEQEQPKIERTAKTMDLPEPEADEVKAAVDLATL